jgi:hypothetical protein
MRKPQVELLTKFKNKWRHENTSIIRRKIPVHGCAFAATRRWARDSIPATQSAIKWNRLPVGAISILVISVAGSSTRKRGKSSDKENDFKQSKLSTNQNNTMETQKEPKVEPVTVDEKLSDIRKRLGRIEMHLIAIRGPRPTKKEQ